MHKCIKDVRIKAVHSRLIMLSSIPIASRFIRYIYLWDTRHFRCCAANTLRDIIDSSDIANIKYSKRRDFIFDFLITNNLIYGFPIATLLLFSSRGEYFMCIGISCAPESKVIFFCNSIT